MACGKDGCKDSGGRPRRSDVHISGQKSVSEAERDQPVDRMPRGWGLSQVKHTSNDRKDGRMAQSSRLALLLLTVTTLVACGGDSGGTGPEDSEPGFSGVGGTWSSFVIHLSGGDITMDYAGFRLSITQSDTTFTGTYSNGTVTIQEAGKVVVVGPMPSSPIAGGSIGVSGAVSFYLDSTEGMHLTGTLSSDARSMSGAVSNAEFSGTQLSGTWTASR